MVPTLFFYHLGLVALMCVFLMLCCLWPNGVAAPRQPIVPTKPPRRKRSKEPKAFAGLTQRPHCAGCEHEAAHPHRGWLGLGNLRANGHPNGGQWRQFQCIACEGYFPEHHGTLFHGKQVAVELIVRVLACLAEGLGIRATARVFEVAPNTVLHWLVEAAEQLTAFSAYVLCEVHVQQLQLDELYAVLSAVKDGEMCQEEAIRRLSRSPHWVWTAIDPVTKLLLTIDVGPRTLAMAQTIVHQTGSCSHQAVCRCF